MNVHSAMFGALVLAADAPPDRAVVITWIVIGCAVLAALIIILGRR